MCAFISLTGLTGALLALIAWLGGPPMAASIIEAQLTSAGFAGTNTTVEVATDPPFDLLAGRVDRIVIRSEQATIDQLRVDRLELALLDADFEARSFSAVDGRLEGVTLSTPDGRSIRASSVDISGPPGGVRAVIRIDAAEVDRVAREEVERQTGVAVGTASLEPPDRVAFLVLVFRVDGRFVVEGDGSLGLIVALPGEPRVGLIADPSIRFESVHVEADQLVLSGTLSLPALDGS